MDKNNLLEELKKDINMPFNYQNITILVDRDELDNITIVKTVNVNLYQTDEYFVGDFYKPVSQIIDFSDLIKK